MEKSRKPNWQPISMLPTIAYIIDGMLQDTQHHYGTLLKAKEKPYVVLDDATVDRLFQVYNSQLDHISIYDEQLNRWKKIQLTSSQREEIERLVGQLEKLLSVTRQILSLGNELRKVTINRIMEKSDIELALDVLSGKIKLPE